MSQDNNIHVPLSLVEYNQLSHLISKLLSTEYPPVIIPAEAILAIEAVAAGIAAPGRTIVNIVTGPYGSLFGKWLERGGATVVEVKVPFDEVVTGEQVASAIKEFNPCALSFVQAEVVTGGSNPAKEIFEIAKAFNLITVTDSVSAVGGEALLVDEWGVDFAVIGAQKALAGPNGVSAVSISPRGWEFLESNKNAPRNSILSLLDLRPSLDSAAPLKVAPNIPSLEARALILALTRIEEEGLAQVIHRHERAAAATLAGIRSLGLEPWQKDSRHYSTLTTTVRITGQQDLQIEQPIGIVAPGDGELFGHLLRINHFGKNASRQSVEDAISTLAQLLRQDPDQALSAIRLAWGA